MDFDITDIWLLTWLTKVAQIPSPQCVCQKLQCSIGLEAESHPDSQDHAIVMNEAFEVFIWQIRYNGLFVVLPAAEKGDIVGIRVEPGSLRETISTV